MATLTINYASDEAITVTTWNSLAADGVATSSLLDNTTNKYVDILIGGTLDTVGTSGAAGETMDVYVLGNWDVDAGSNLTGGIDTALTASDSTLTQDVELNLLNMYQIASVALESNAPTTSQGYHWGPVAVAQVFGGILPQKFCLLLHNNTGAAMSASGNVVNAVGIKYDITA